jgi:hypothetical protein
MAAQTCNRSGKLDMMSKPARGVSDLVEARQRKVAELQRDGLRVASDGGFRLFLKEQFFTSDRHHPCTTSSSSQTFCCVLPIKYLSPSGDALSKE